MRIMKITHLQITQNQTDHLIVIPVNTTQCIEAQIDIQKMWPMSETITFNENYSVDGKFYVAQVLSLTRKEADVSVNGYKIRTIHRD